MSMNDNQSYFVADGRTTSKVLREPGGGSSLNLGWDDGSQNANPNQDRSASNSILLEKRRRAREEVSGKIGSPMKDYSQQPQPLADYSQQQATPHYNLPPQNTAAPNANHNHGHLGLSQGSNAFANGGNQNCGNIITDRCVLQLFFFLSCFFLFLVVFLSTFL